MNNGNLATLGVQVCYDLTERAGRFTRPFLRRSLGVHLFKELALIGELPVAALVEKFPQRLC